MPTLKEGLSSRHHMNHRQGPVMELMMQWKAPLEYEQAATELRDAAMG